VKKLEFTSPDDTNSSEVITPQYIREQESIVTEEIQEFDKSGSQHTDKRTSRSRPGKTDPARHAKFINERAVQHAKKYTTNSFENEYIVERKEWKYETIGDKHQWRNSEVLEIIEDDTTDEKCAKVWSESEIAIEPERGILATFNTNGNITGDFMFIPNAEDIKEKEARLEICEGLVVVNKGMFKALVMNHKQRDKAYIKKNTIVGILRGIKRASVAEITIEMDSKNSKVDSEDEEEETDQYEKYRKVMKSMGREKTWGAKTKTS
jgi:hypothetical protein